MYNDCKTRLVSKKMLNLADIRNYNLKICVIPFKDDFLEDFVDRLLTCGICFK